MKNQTKYKSLIQNFINYLKNSEYEFFENKNSFLKLKIQKKDKNIIKETQKTQTFNLSQQNTYQKTFQTKKNEIKKDEKMQISQKEITPLEKTKKENLNQHIQSSFINIFENKKIKIEEKPKIIEDNFNDIKNIIKKISKNIPTTDTILDDKIAKQKSQKYKLKNFASNLTILAYKENEKHYKFLQNLAIALNNYFYPTKLVSAYVIEKENNWDILLYKNEIYLIIASDYTIFELTSLKRYYKKNSSTKEKFLANIPLFLLPDISIYLKEPTLKSSLFKALQQKITNLKK